MKRRAAAEMSEHQSDTTRTGGFESRMRPNTGKGGSERDEFGNEVSNVNDNFLLIADAFGPKPRWYAHYVKFSKSKREG